MPLGLSPRRLISLTATAAVAGGALLAVPTAASAAPNQRVPNATTWGAWKRCPSGPSSLNCASIVTTAENPSTHLLWAAGDFTNARDSQTGSMKPYSNLLAINTSNGALDTQWPSHTFNGKIYAAAVDTGRNTLYVGGNFTTVDGSGTGAKYIAALDMKTGAVKRGFSVSANNSVRALVYSGTTNLLYIGGKFTQVQGQAHTRLAAVDPVSGAVSKAFRPPSIRWTETKQSQLTEVRTLATGYNTGTTPMLYVGGHFDSVGGKVYKSIVRVNLKTGELGSSFSPRLYAFPNDNALNVMKIVYIGRSSTSRGGVVVGQGGHYNRGYRFNLDGSMDWTVSANGDYQAAAVNGNTVYFGGHFTCVAPSNGSCYFKTTRHFTRVHLSAVNVSTGGLDHTFAVRLSPTSKPYYWGIWTLRVGSGGTLWAGGDFRLVKTSTATYVRDKLAGFKAN